MTALPSRLEEARAQVCNELTRVDSKAATLLSAVSVFVAAAVFALDKVKLPTLSQIGLGVAADAERGYAADCVRHRR